MGLIHWATDWLNVEHRGLPALVRRWRIAYLFLAVAFVGSLFWFSTFAEHQHAKDARTNRSLLATNAQLRATAAALANTQASVDYTAKKVAHRLAVVAWDACVKRNEQNERLIWVLASQGIVTSPVVEKCPPKPGPLPPFKPPVPSTPAVTTTTRVATTTRKVARVTTTSVRQCPGRNVHSCAACRHHKRPNC